MDYTMGIGGVGALLVIWLGFLSKAVTASTKELNDLKVKIAERYVSKEGLADFKKEMIKRLDRLERLLINGGRNND